VLKSPARQCLPGLALTTAQKILENCIGQRLPESRIDGMVND